MKHSSDSPPLQVPTLQAGLRVFHNPWSSWPFQSLLSLFIPVALEFPKVPHSRSILCLGHPAPGPYQHLHGACSKSPLALLCCPTLLLPRLYCTHSPVLVGLSQVRMTSNSPTEVTTDGLMTKPSSQFSDLCSLDLLTHLTHISLDFQQGVLSCFLPRTCSFFHCTLPPALPAFWMLERLRQVLNPLFFLTMLFLWSWLVPSPRPYPQTSVL